MMTHSQAVVDLSVAATQTVETATSLKSTERRRGGRRTVAWPTLWRGPEGAPQQGVLCDVSERGAFVRAYAGSSIVDLQPGSRVRLTVFDDESSDRRFIVLGTVRWIGDHGPSGWAGAGVQFDLPQSSIAGLG